MEFQNEQIVERISTELLKKLYCCDEKSVLQQKKRYDELVSKYVEQFGNNDGISIFSAPGRTEIGGNHTDHQHGCVLAGAVTNDMIAVVAPNGSNTIRLKSEGYAPSEVNLDDLVKRDGEENTSISILRGSCEAYRVRGAKLFGMDIYVSSNVPKGSGISSSAAFEVLLGTALNELCMGENKVSPVEIAQIGHLIENGYFGKPSGMMDQIACSMGGVVAIDFADTEKPSIRKLDFDLNEAGLALCVIDSGADHADLTEEYAAVTSDCRSIAKLCGGEVLRDISREAFMKTIPQLRGKVTDRAIQRAMHFFGDTERAQQEADALEKKDFDTFLQLVEDSGHSSWEYLQNVIPAGELDQQSVALAICTAKEFLGGRGAVRVHGGGFAGTVQAFVPCKAVPTFKAGMENIFGIDSCHIMKIRPVGSVRVL